MMKNECDGGCLINGDCKGKVRRVRVIGPAATDYGCFNYCQTAIDKDRQNGFYVNEDVEDDCQGL